MFFFPYKKIFYIYSNLVFEKTSTWYINIIIHPKPMFAINILMLETLPPKVHAYTWFERRKTLY